MKNSKRIQVAIFWLLIAGILLLSDKIINYIDPRIALVALLMAVFVFLRDPIRNKAVRGYKPTYYAGVLDPAIRKVLLLHYNTSKGVLPYLKFVQGGDTGKTAYEDAKETLEHRTGLTMQNASYTVNEITPLGCCAINSPDITHVATDRFTPFSRWRGKGFLFVVFSMDLSDEEKIAQLIKLPQGVHSYKIIDVDQLPEHIEAAKKDTDSDAKAHIYDRAYDCVMRFLERKSYMYKPKAESITDSIQQSDQKSEEAEKAIDNITKTLEKS